jgi:hypothetical protein
VTQYERQYRKNLAEQIDIEAGESVLTSEQYKQLFSMEHHAAQASYKILKLI